MLRQLIPQSGQVIQNEVPLNAVLKPPRNEVNDFRNARWWCPPEAFWKLAGFTVHKQMPPVTRMVVHLENEQIIISDVANMEDVDERQRLRRLAEKSTKTQLVQWFALNERESNIPCAYPEGTSAPELLFTEIPRYYIWSPMFEWQRRKKFSSAYPPISRMYTVHVNADERYFLRRLLFYVRGPTCFDDVKTVDDEVCDTFREACLRRKLLTDDTEWHCGLKENVDVLMPVQLRHLLFQIYVYV